MKNRTYILKSLQQTEFDKEIWYAAVGTISVQSDHDITFTFKDGTELSWKI